MLPWKIECDAAAEKGTVKKNFEAQARTVLFLRQNTQQSFRPCQIQYFEIGAAFLVAQSAIEMRTALIEMGHPQQPTPIEVDNSTAAGFANKIIKQKRSKAIDMRYYCFKTGVIKDNLKYIGPQETKA